MLNLLNDYVSLEHQHPSGSDITESSSEADSQPEQSSHAMHGRGGYI